MAIFNAGGRLALLREPEREFGSPQQRISAREAAQVAGLLLDVAQCGSSNPKDGNSKLLPDRSGFASELEHEICSRRLRKLRGAATGATGRNRLDSDDIGP